MDDKDRNEKSKALRLVLEPAAKEMAEKITDDLEVKGGLLQPRDFYIKQKKEEILTKLEKEMLAFERNFELAGDLLREHIATLSEVQKGPIQKEMEHGFSLLAKWAQELKNGKINMPKDNESLQSILGFSNQTLLWMYEIGYQFFEKKEYEKALAIFQILTVLNHFISDYWVAYALTLRRLNKEAEALYAFSIASMTNPENPLPRYNAIELYLALNQPENAALELKALEEIIKTQKLTDLQPALEAIRSKVHFIKAS